MTCCPTCGQDSARPWLFDFTAGHLVIAGRSVVLTPSEAALVGVLLKRAGVPHTSEKLIAALYGGHGAGPDGNVYSTLYTLLHNLRAKLKGTGLRLEHRRGFGYVAELTALV